MFSAIILAAGHGKRMNYTKKQFFKLKNKMIVEFSVNTFLKANAAEIILAVNLSHLTYIKNLFKHQQKIKVVAGGSTRQQSAKNAFLACNKNNKLVLIHDAARPFITSEAIKKLVKVAQKTHAATLASFATDTIKLVKNKKVHTTLDRKNVVLIQTPQAFDVKLYEKALKLAEKSNLNPTDDCQLVEKMHFPIAIVENSKLNFKITTTLDLQIAEFLANNLKFET